MRQALARQPALHWSAGYVGLSLPGASPCWELARHVYWCERGVSLPAFSAGPAWQPVDDSEARDFDLLMFRAGGVAEHVGIVVDGDLMLHLPFGRTSVVEPWRTGEFLPSLAGVYRHVEKPSLIIPGVRLSTEEHAGGFNVVGLPFINPAQDRVDLKAPRRTSLLDAMRLAFPAATDAQLARMHVWIDNPSNVIAPEYRARLYPHPDTVVTIQPLPGISIGGLFRLIIATAAMALGQFYLGPLAAAALFPAGGIGATVTTALVTAATVTAATLAFNYLVPMRENKEDSPSFFASGWNNEARPYGIVPAPAGRQRMSPPFGAAPFLRVMGDDDVRLVSLFVEGIGPLAKSKMQIGETDIYQFDGGIVESGISDAAGTWLVATHYVYREIVSHGGNFYLCIDTHTSSAASEPGVGVDWETYWHEGNPAEGEEDDPVTIPVSIESNEGYLSDLPHTIYDHQVVGSDGMGATIDYGEGDVGEWMERAAARDAAELEIILGFPYGLFVIDEGDGSKQSTSLFFDIHYADITGDDWIVVEDFFEVRRSRDKPFYVSYKWTPAERADYKVRIRNSGAADFDPDGGRNDAQWTELYAHRPEYPLNFPVPVASTAIEVRGSEQLQGQLDAFNLIVSRVAPDWDADTETWITRETANPASFIRWALQGPANAKPATDAKANLPELQDLHEFCDEKGLKYHSLRDVEAVLPDVLSEVAHAGRTTMRHDGQKWGVVIDRPRLVVSGHVTPRNGWEVAVSRQRAELDDGFAVSFRDETSNWEVKQRRVPFPGVVSPSVFRTLDLPGKTDPDEIYREAMRRHFEETYRRKVYSAMSGWDAMTLTRGVQVMFDDGLDRSRVSAHVRRIDGSRIELDETVVMEAGEDYELRWRRLPEEGVEADDDPPAQSVVRRVQTIPGRSKVLLVLPSGGAQETMAVLGVSPDMMLAVDGGTVLGTPSYIQGDFPAPGDLVIFAKASLTGRPVIIQRIEGADKLNARLTCLDAAPIIDELTDALVIPEWDGRVGDVVNPDAPPPEDIAVSLMFSVVSGGLTAFARVTWTAEPAFSYQVGYRKVGNIDNLSTVDTLAGASMAATGVLAAADDWEVAVRVRHGIWSAWAPVPGDITLLAGLDGTLLAIDDQTLAGVS